MMRVTVTEFGARGPVKTSEVEESDKDVFDEPLAADSSFRLVEAVATNQEEVVDFLKRLPVKSHGTKELSSHSARVGFTATQDHVNAYIRTAHYVDEPEHIEFSDLFISASPELFAIAQVTLEESDPNITWDDEALEHCSTPLDLLLLLLAQVAASYGETAVMLEEDVDDVELEVFGGDVKSPEHIYRLGREILLFEQAVLPIAEDLADFIDLVEDARRAEPVFLQTGTHIARRLMRTAARARALRELLGEVSAANSALVGIQQNEDTKKISSWAAILVVPTLIAGIYGMNFKVMPEIGWFFGYPFALLLMILTSSILYGVFRRKDWL